MRKNSLQRGAVTVLVLIGVQQFFQMRGVFGFLYGIF